MDSALQRTWSRPSGRVPLLFLVFSLVSTLLLGATGAAGRTRTADTTGSVYTAFTNASPVQIDGYSGDEMEPDISPNGKFLLFNNLNQPPSETTLLFATANGNGSFTFEGQIRGVNDRAALTAVPSLARDGVLYFISNRSYSTTLSTVYRALFSAGSVTGVQPVPGVVAPQAGMVDFDVDVAPNDRTLYVSLGTFANGAATPSASEILIYNKAKRGSYALNAHSSEILSAVNRPGALTYAADISGHGRVLFFTQSASNSSQPSIYRATRSGPGQPFGNVQLVAAASGFVEAPSVSSNGRTLYFHKLVNGHYVICRATQS
jgi:Tol biopolymer transport system component